MAQDSKHTREEDAGRVHRMHGDARSDTRQCHIVDAAIALQGSSNTMAALEYLRRRDIPAGIITRVLLEPARRRVR